MIETLRELAYSALPDSIGAELLERIVRGESPAGYSVQVDQKWSQDAVAIVVVTKLTGHKRSIKLRLSICSVEESDVTLIKLIKDTKPPACKLIDNGYGVVLCSAMIKDSQDWDDLLRRFFVTLFV